MHLRLVRKLLSRNPLRSYAKPKSPLPPIPLTTLPNRCSIFDKPNQRTSMISRTHIKYVKQYSADAVDDINLKFAEAREEIESAMESKETVYFNEEAECARRAVGEVVDMYEGLLRKLPEKDKAAVQRAMGLKIQQLKAELQQLDD
ncbi:hypothetical protein F511_01295 [Dorcoceras hygrometricum]|uniref:Uncharacterized protein n=1 Tax=Dorcoceras hygrometricum TaxID=472368 RepID=A0A2Z7D698_9LAMI|nr:hypothetical protein F511_01295 [Dorcoceras hygrometricum]